MVQGNAKAKFDETLEAHVRLGIEKGRSELSSGSLYQIAAQVSSRLQSKNSGYSWF
ncbi:hypothetical protein YC2023_047675 [Brassica napus]